MDGLTKTRCALDALAEPLAGTAATDDTHLLLEHPGPWGHKAWQDSDLPADVRERVAAAAKTAGVRLHLIRRHGRTARPQRPQVFFAHTRPGSAWLQRTEIDDVHQLLEVDFETLAGGTAPGFEQVTEPLVLVCTNGRRDACCATLGRPVVKALTEAHPALTWESSHLGGHRFAAAMLALPTGLAYGRLDAVAALDVVDRTLAGHLDPSHLRGRGSYPHPVQAAEVALLIHLGETRVDALELVDSRAVDGRQQVRFRRGDDLFTVAVTKEPGPRVRTSCTDTQAKETSSWVARLG